MVKVQNPTAYVGRQASECQLQIEVEMMCNQFNNVLRYDIEVDMDMIAHNMVDICPPETEMSLVV